MLVCSSSANIFSRLTFSWMSGMMQRGTDHTLDEEDLWDLPTKDSAEGLSNELRVQWEQQLKKKKCATQFDRFLRCPDTDAQLPIPSSPSLTIAVLKAFGGPFFLASIFKLIQDTMAFAQPQLLKRLLSFVSSYSTSHPEEPFHGSVIAFGMLFVSVTQTAFLHQYFQRAFETGMRFRGGLVGLMYVVVYTCCAMSNDFFCRADKACHYPTVPLHLIDMKSPCD